MYQLVIRSGIRAFLPGYENGAIGDPQIRTFTDYSRSLYQNRFKMSPRIFIVDNNHSSRDLLSRIVKALGFSNIRAFSDPFNVLSAVELGDFPALVISDLNIPGLDGVALLNCLSFISSSIYGIIITSDKNAALERTDMFPILDKTSRMLFDQMWDFIRGALGKTHRW